VKKLNQEEINKIISLRERGKTLTEIIKVLNRGKGTIYKYIKDVKIKKEYKEDFLDKKFASKMKSRKEWESAKVWSKLKINRLSERDILLISAMLYWDEGNKQYELNLINSDYFLIKLFIKGLMIMGVKKEKIKISIRIFNDIDKNKAIRFWLNKLSLNKKNLVSVNVINGSKNGKLKFGMCRVRVEKGSLYFKQIMSMIDTVKLL
jgi:hypothetical protein